MALIPVYELLSCVPPDVCSTETCAIALSLTPITYDSGLPMCLVVGEFEFDCMRLVSNTGDNQVAHRTS